MQNLRSIKIHFGAESDNFPLEQIQVSRDGSEVTQPKLLKGLGAAALFFVGRAAVADDDAHRPLRVSKHGPLSPLCNLLRQAKKYKGDAHGDFLGVLLSPIILSNAKKLSRGHATLALHPEVSPSTQIQLWVEGKRVIHRQRINKIRESLEAQLRPEPRNSEHMPCDDWVKPGDLTDLLWAIEREAEIDDSARIFLRLGRQWFDRNKDIIWVASLPAESPNSQIRMQIILLPLTPQGEALVVSPGFSESGIRKNHVATRDEGDSDGGYRRFYLKTVMSNDHLPSDGPLVKAALLAVPLILCRLNLHEHCKGYLTAWHETTRKLLQDAGIPFGRVGRNVQSNGSGKESDVLSVDCSREILDRLIRERESEVQDAELPGEHLQLVLEIAKSERRTFPDSSVEQLVGRAIIEARRQVRVKSEILTARQYRRQPT